MIPRFPGAPQGEAPAEEPNGQLLDLAAELGFRLSMAGAEVDRVEESMQRFLRAYGVESGEVFAITNCVMVSLTDEAGRSSTRIRQVPAHGTDLTRLMAYNALSREVASTAPALEEVQRQMEELAGLPKGYPVPVQILGSAVGAGAYALFFGGSLWDAVAAGLCGAVVGLCNLALDYLETNQFIRTIVGGAVSALCALLLVGLGVGKSVDAVITGALMLLVPGLIFTNAMRNILTGNLISGPNLVLQALLIATAIALGTGFVLSLAGSV